MNQQRDRVVPVVSPRITVKSWTHPGLTLDSPWTHSEEGTANVYRRHLLDMELIRRFRNVVAKIERSAEMIQIYFIQSNDPKNYCSKTLSINRTPSTHAATRATRGWPAVNSWASSNVSAL